MNQLKLKLNTNLKQIQQSNNQKVNYQSLISQNICQKFEEELTCPLTMNLMEDPHDLPCSHAFSKLSIIKALKMKNQCPLCRLKFQIKDLRQNRILRNMVDQLKDQKKRQQDLQILNLQKIRLENEKIIRETIKIYHNNGSQYEGQILNGKMDGRGIFLFSNGSKYKGEFKDNKINGKGTYFENNGNKYIGEFVDEKKNGKGVYFFNNENKYQGDFENDNMNGMGTLFYSNGDKYIGNYKDGKQSGKGTYYYSNGDRYEGEYSNGVKNGGGTIFYRNGVQSIQIWKKGDQIV